MNVDISKIKPGDEVLIRCKVMLGEHCGDLIRVQTDDVAPRDFPVQVGAVVSHTPRPLAIGDKVRQRPDGQHGEVLGLHGVQAWVRWGGNDFATTYAEGLERVDA